MMKQPEKAYSREELLSAVWGFDSEVETRVTDETPVSYTHLESATIRNFRIVQTEGSRQFTRDTKHYNLQMIIAVGFKVNNERAVQFRKWANGIVKDYTIKGWVMDDERLKNGGSVPVSYTHLDVYKRQD